MGLVLFSKNLIRSKMGRAFLAVAASEDGASAVGIDVGRIKLSVFVIGATFAGLAEVFSLVSCPRPIPRPSDSTFPSSSS